MKKNQRRALRAATAALCLVLALGAIPLAAAKETEPEPAVFGIDKTYLKAGETLTVNNPDGCTLRYFVNDVETEGESLTLSESLYEQWITVKAYSNGEEVATDRAYFSKLPVIYIDTADNKPITSKEEYKTASMLIQNNTAGSAVYNDGIQIKGRGNSTWLMPKKPYRIKLDKKTDLFGMGKNKNWVLLSNYLDESLLRNTTASQLSEQLELNTMNTVWTDVVLNGEYAGNYQLCEQIRIDKTRIDIFDWEDYAADLASAVNKAEKKKGNTIDKDALEDCLTENLGWITSGTFNFNGEDYNIADYGFETCENVSGGYLFELSNEYDEASKFTTAGGLKVMVKSPEFLTTNDNMMSCAQQCWQDFENACKAEDGYADTADGRLHYTQLGDFESMVSYWLTLEIMGNNDAVWKSRFAYKDIDGPIIFGPVWDFDYGCGSSAVGPYPRGWILAKAKDVHGFFKEFLDDPVFISRATERYWEVRPFLQSLIEDGGTLDSEIDYLRESGLADQERWDRAESWPDKARGFLNDASMFKTYLTERIAWLDRQFASDDTLLKSVRLNESASPYYVSERLHINLRSARPDTVSQYAAADGAIGADESLTLSAYLTDGSVSAVQVYVNGLLYDTLLPTDGAVRLTIPGEALSTEMNRKNVISLIAKDSQGVTTDRTFATVLRAELPALLVGDVNRDGAVNIQDATEIQRHLAEYEGADGMPLIDEADAEELRLADVNKDRIVNIRDITAMQRVTAEFFA